MSDIEWPEGATHRIANNWVKTKKPWFAKWDDGVEFYYEDSCWCEEPRNWPLKKYTNNVGFGVTERPKEPEAKEPVINWDEQPTPEHCWAEDLNDDKDPDFEGWCKKCHDGSWRMDNAFSVWAQNAESKGNVKIHRKPETEPYKPEVGEWFIASGGAKMAFVGIDSGNAYVCEIDGGGLTRLCDFIGCRPIKSEREQFIEKFHGMDAGQMYDNGARFTDEN